MAVAYIIDDEEHAALLLRDKLLDVTDYFDNIEIFIKPVLAYQAIIDKRPDLIFSDIEMPLIKGIDLHKKISNLNIPFIYVTAYSSFTFEAIKLQAFDYIMKPVKEEELEETIKRFILSAEPKIENEEIRNSTQLSFYELMQKQKERITVSTSEGVFFISMEDIVKIEALNNYSCIYLKDKSALVASKTLKHFETQLTGFGFIRTHKSYLVNMVFIERLLSSEGGQLLLNTGESVDVTREKATEIKEWFSAYHR